MNSHLCKSRTVFRRLSKFKDLSVNNNAFFNTLVWTEKAIQVYQEFVVTSCSTDAFFILQTPTHAIRNRMEIHEAIYAAEIKE